MQIRKILYPTDFSSFSTRALAHALFLAQQYGAELHMLHVIVLHGEDPHNPAHHFPDLDEVRARLEELASDGMRKVLDEQAIEAVPIKQVQRRNVSAAPAIIEYAEEEDVDLIVMSTHGRRGVRHLLIGSVTEEVIRMAPCSVLSVRGDAEITQDVQNILVPVDFSQHAREALGVARSLGAQYGAKLQLVHVLEALLHPAFYNMGATSIKDLQPDIEERTEAKLRQLYEQSGGGEEPELYVIEGHAGRDIARFADHHDSDLIVISTHGLTGLEGLLMGGVAEKVVRRARVPVLIVKAFERSLLTD